jgi:hypothetical protein
MKGETAEKDKDAEKKREGKDMYESDKSRMRKGEVEKSGLLVTMSRLFYNSMYEGKTKFFIISLRPLLDAHFRLRLRKEQAGQ